MENILHDFILFLLFYFFCKSFEFDQRSNIIFHLECGFMFLLFKKYFWKIYFLVHISLGCKAIEFLLFPIVVIIVLEFILYIWFKLIGFILFILEIIKSFDQILKSRWFCYCSWSYRQFVASWGRWKCSIGFCSHFFLRLKCSDRLF